MTLPKPRAIPRGGARNALSEREAEIVALVGRFRLMTAEQIRAVMFPAQASKTPLDRALLRLTAGEYLVRLARSVGGIGGGSGQYVYQLGRAGWRLLGKGGGYRPLRTADLHTLTITECFVAFQRLEQCAALTVITYQPEPGSHLTVARTPLTPDAYVELGVHSPRRKFTYWLEIDRDTENPDTIRGKCVRYWHAFQAWTGDVFPWVVFVVPDAGRQREIERVIAGGPGEAQQLFRVEQLETFAEVIHRNML
jgi:Replication-relaxation